MAGQLSQFQELLKSIDDGLVVFADTLIAKGYGSRKRLRAASREGLLSVNGIEQGDADLIVHHFKEDDSCSFDELVRAPLPSANCSGSSKSVNDKDADRQTHPTQVLRYETYNDDVKARLQQADVQEWRSTRYEKTGVVCHDYQLGEDGAVACLQASAGYRVNHVFENHHKRYRYVIHPSRRKTNSQEQECAAFSEVELQPEEVVHRDASDLCLVQNTGLIRKVAQVIECKHTFRLLDAHHYHFADIFDGFKCNPKVVPGGFRVNAAYNVVHAISQELGYMARRGHKTGIISTYHHTWLLQTDGLGCVWISEAIPSDRRGDDRHASVTEVMLYSALCNLDNQKMDPYPTAQAPGQPPISVDTSRERRKAAAERLSAQRAVGQQEVSSSGQVAGGRCTRSGQSYSRAAPLPAGALHLTCRLVSLAGEVFLGSLFGRAAAVRLAVGADAQQAAQLEAEAYERLQPLQGVVVPRLLAHGYTLGGDAYFVATEFIEGTTWDWHLAAHRALDAEVLSALDKIHKLGVLHGDLHEGNILVTPDCKVVVLDFNGARLEAPATELTAEHDHVAMLLAVQVEVH